MKKLTTVIAIILLTGIIAYPVFAHGPGWGSGRGQHMMGNWGGGPGYYCGQHYGGYGNLTPEQQTKLDELNGNFFDETNTLRNEIRAKSGELNSILNSPNPDTEKAKALQKEINGLKAQMAEKGLELDLEARKAVPDVPRRSARGYGHHRGAYGQPMGAYGHRMGAYGHHRGAYGHRMGAYGHQMGAYGHHRGGYGPHMGYGGHMGGYGPHMGYGGHMGGYGPGGCWQ